MALPRASPKASLKNGVRADARGRDTGAGRHARESGEWPRAQVTRLTMERDIAKKAAAYFAQEVLHGTPGFTR